MLLPHTSPPLVGDEDREAGLASTVFFINIVLFLVQTSIHTVRGIGLAERWFMHSNYIPVVRLRLCRDLSEKGVNAVSI